MSVMWNALMGAPNPGEAFSQAYQQGVAQREQREMRQEMMQERQEDRQFRRDQMMQDQAWKQVEQHRDAIKVGAAIIRQFNPQDPATWQQARAALGQYGVNPDALGVPQDYQPEYVQGVLKIADALEPAKQRDISGVARELMDAGFQPGTPQFQTAMRDVLNGKYANEYTDEGGNVRRRSALNLPGSTQPAAIPNEAIAELKANPNTAQQFDEVFGPGAAQRVLGEGGPQAHPLSGPFPNIGQYPRF